MYAQIWTHTHRYTCMHTYTHACIAHTYIILHTCIHTNINIHIHTYMHTGINVHSTCGLRPPFVGSDARSRSGMNQFDIVALFSCPMRLREGSPFYRSGIARGMFGRGRNSVWRVCNHTYNVFQSQIRCRVNKVEHKQRTPINKGTQTQYLPSKQITSPTWPSNKR